MRWAAGRNNGMAHPDEAAYRIRVEVRLYDSSVPAPLPSLSRTGPDGTPEKPWTRVEEIGEGAWFGPKSMPGVHLSKSGRRWFVMKDEANQLPHTPRTMNDLAPFVRVDGDKA
ncbi:hypothetical protein GS883_18260 [Rhodococcus hoagii]|nr:hypothetical protein [Prescottella equi]